VLGRAFALAHPELGVEVIVGEEVSTLNGHVKFTVCWKTSLS
jgi:hypothetical protein